MRQRPIARYWSYGFPEMTTSRRDVIANGRFVANPGYYPTGFIALLRPVVEANLVPRSWPVSVNAMSGYTGGGRRMIAEFEDEDSTEFTRVPFRIYGLACRHKHVPEMKAHAGLDHLPLFTPSVGRYAQDMIVEVPLALHSLPSKPRLGDLHAALAGAYDRKRFMEVATPDEASSVQTLAPDNLNGTNKTKLYVFGSETLGQARLVAVFDNLGKGASGAAVQNLNLMLGFAGETGLDRSFEWSTAL